MYGQEQVEPFTNKLNQLLDQETVRGEILDLDQFTSRWDEYQTWKKNSVDIYNGTPNDPRENVRMASKVVKSIKSIVCAKWLEQKYADVKCLILVGSDAVIPFYRNPQYIPKCPPRYQILLRLF